MDRLAIGRTDAENHRDDDVLERGDEEECRVLIADRVQLVRVNDWRLIPGNLRILATMLSASDIAPSFGTHHG